MSDYKKEYDELFESVLDSVLSKKEYTPNELNHIADGIEGLHEGEGLSAAVAEFLKHYSENMTTTECDKLFLKVQKKYNISKKDLGSALGVNK